MLRLLTHPLLLSVLATAIVWALVIVYWQATATEVSFEDIALYMLGLPVLLIGAGLGIRALLRRRQASPATAKAATVDAQSGATSSAEDAGAQRFTLALLGAGIATAAGEDKAAVLAALKAKEVRPGPDGEIKNRDGFPVILTRVPDLALGEAETALLQSSAPPSPMTLRTLALLRKAFAPVADILHSIALDAHGEPKEQSANSVPTPRLIVDLLVPPAWDAAQRRQVLAAANCLLADTGWPDDARVLRTLDTGQCLSALHQLDKFNLEANLSRSPDYYLVLACESQIDQELIAGLESRNALFGPATPKGAVPGEAAVAVLVRRVIDGAPHPPMALIGRAAQAVRGKSIDSTGRTGCDELAGATTVALEQAQIPAAQIAEVFGDIDQHSGRCAECVGTLNALLPHVDPAEQFVAVGQSLGRLDSTGPLLALAIAAEALANEGQPVLLIAALHATERLAMPLLPPTQAVSA